MKRIDSIIQFFSKIIKAISGFISGFIHKIKDFIRARPKLTAVIGRVWKILSITVLCLFPVLLCFSDLLSYRNVRLAAQNTSLLSNVVASVAASNNPLIALEQNYYESPLTEGAIELKSSIMVAPWDNEYDEYGYGPDYDEGSWYDEGDQDFIVAAIPPITPASKITFMFKSKIVSNTDFSKLIRFSPKIAGDFQYEGSSKLSFIPRKGVLKADSTLHVTISSELLGHYSGKGSYSGSIPIRAFSMGPFTSELTVLQPPKARYIDVIDSTLGSEAWNSDIVVFSFSRESDGDSPSDEYLGKGGGYSAERGKPRFIMPYNWGTGRMGKGPVILLFDQPVSPEAFSASITAKGPTGSLKVSVQSVYAQPETDDFGVADTACMLAVSVDKLPSDGSTITFSVPSYDVSGKRITVPVTLEVFTRFEAESYELESLSQGLAEFEENITINFNGPIRTDDFLDFLQIVPKPRRMDMQYGSSGVELRLALDVGTTYTVSLRPDFEDLLGNSLAKSFSYSFKTRDLEPFFEPAAGVLVLEKDSNRMPVKMRNIERITAEIFCFNDPWYFLMAARDGSPNFMDEKVLRRIEYDASQLAMNYINRVDLGIDGEPGLKVIVFTAWTSGSEAFSEPITTYAFVQTTNIGLSCKLWNSKILVWATSLANGKPLDNVKISLSNSDMSVMTNAEGVAILDTNGMDEFVSASLGTDISILKLDPAEMSEAWQFNLPDGTRNEKLGAVLFTERGVYRPGETVLVKLFLASAEKALSREAIFVVTDSRGDTVFTSKAALDEFGGASFRLDLGVAASAGKYSVKAGVSGSSAEIRTSFLVEEYKVPSFGVTVMDSSTSWSKDAPVSVTAHASYYMGEPLSGRPVKWRVFRQPELFKLSAFPGYVFDLPISAAEIGTVASGSGVLNQNGDYPITFIPELVPRSGSMRFIVEAIVTDVDRQAFTGRISKVVSGAKLRVGVKPPESAIYSEGAQIKVPVAVVDTSGTLLAGKWVKAFLDEIEYHQTSIETLTGFVETYNREVIRSIEIAGFSSNTTPRDYQLYIDKAGKYRVRFSVADADGIESFTGFEFAVTGKTAIKWPRFSQDRIELIADKAAYKVGDTAKLVVQSPYKYADALLTVESDGVIGYKYFKISNDTPAIEVPILESYQGRIYVSVILVRGREHKLSDATGFETGAPGYKIGYVALNVEKKDTSLKVSLQSPAVLKPGSSCEIKIMVKREDAAPATASVALMVVDEAVLALTGYGTPDPLATAFPINGLIVKNASNILDLPYARRAREEELFPGGDSDEIMAIPYDKSEIIRKLFKSTAYWNPDVRTASDGTATVVFTLPDNLTAYRIMAVATDGKGRFGASSSSITAKKPLMAQVSLPRFARLGDTFSIDAILFNETGSDVNATVAFDVSGVSLIAKPQAAASIKAGGIAKIVCTVKADEAGSARIQFSAKAGTNSDTVEVLVPVYQAVTYVAGGQVGKTSKDYPLIVNIPEGIDLASLEAKIAVSRQTYAALGSAVKYLLQYPHGCIEQTTGTAWPLIMMKDLLPVVDSNYNMEEWKKMAQAGIERLLTFVTPSGGLSYWPGGRDPHLFGSAYGAWVLAESARQGFLVPRDVLTNLAQYLENTLRTNLPVSITQDDIAFLCLTLGKLGRPQSAYIQSVWKKGNLGLFGLACLALAAKEAAGSAYPLEEILASIRDALKLENGKLRYTELTASLYSMASRARSLGAALYALSVCDPGSALAAPVEDELLAEAKNGRWSNTQANAFALMGFVARKETVSANNFTVIAAGKRVDKADMKHLGMEVYSFSLPRSEFPKLVKQGSSFTIETDFAMPLTIGVQYTCMLLPGTKIPAIDHGIKVERTLYSSDGKTLGTSQIQRGSLIEVRLRITVPTTLYYIAITDHLPAGFEALNTALTTTETIISGKDQSGAMQKGLEILSYSEIRDDRVLFYTDKMPAGTYEFVFYARATGAGSFVYPSAEAEAMYATENYGSSGSLNIVIR